MLRRAAALAPALGGSRRLSHWATLRVKQGSSHIDVKAAYRALCLRWHPDVCSDVGADRKMCDINEAYEALTRQGGAAADRGTSDAERRKAAAKAAAKTKAAAKAEAAAEQGAASDAAFRKATAAAEKRRAAAERGAAKDAAHRRAESQMSKRMKQAAADHNAAIDAALRADSRMDKAAAHRSAAIEVLRRAESQMQAATAEHGDASEGLRRADSRVRAAAASHAAAREAAGRRMIYGTNAADLTITELKVLLKERGLGTSGLKADLVRRLAGTRRFSRPSPKLFEAIAWFR
ncbi:hypothetical protein M885DRAFT_519352 [Pelagophyceae sp. CCMP2097]|nr:hypothetical protein M885DRAFT_519352 [Pelagophyceae sp. CCMP2097]